MRTRLQARGVFLGNKILDRSRFTPLFLFCFFFSGACGLIYQVAWLRMLSLFFGNTTFATSTILSSYMAGLGLGALYFGRRIDSDSRHPVRVYAWLEGGVALYAFLTPLLWKLIEILHIGFVRSFNPDYLTASLFKFAAAFAALFLPTFLMGGTLPVVSRYFVSRREDTAKHVGMLYALNTLGAVAGVVFSGFYALYSWGVWQTVFFAGAANLLIFLLMKDFGGSQAQPALKPSKSPSSAAPAAASADPASGTISQTMRVMLVLFAFSGAVSMLYEIGWTRVLAIVLGSSTYAFSVMLATFLLGIALGSYLFSLAARRWRLDFFAFTVMQGLTSLSVLWGLNRFDDIPYWFVQVYVRSQGDPLLMELGRFMICASVMLIPTLLIGALFTSFMHAFRGSGKLGHDVGAAYFSNTAGTILGAALAGFAIVPLVGIQKTLILGAALNALIGVVSFGLMPENRTRRRYAAGGALIAAVLLAALRVEPWNIHVISSDTAVNPARIQGLTREQFLASLKEKEILFYKEGLSATVSVARVKDNVSLAVNGKVDASNSDAFTQYLLGHLPLLLHPDPQRVAVIGLGSGSTVAAAAAHPVKVIDAVELEKAVVEASKFFPDLNRNVLEDSRVRMHVNDGRNFILVTRDRYDVIISEPSNPWMAGVANLFSKEHFATMRERLLPGGLVCQWLHAYSMAPSDLAMIMRTFSEAFPYVQLWTSYYPDLMLIGYTQKPALDLETLRFRMNAVPLVMKDLRPHGITSAEALMSSFWLDDAQIRELSKRAELHTDNHPRLEFSAPRNLYARTFDKNYVLLDSVRRLDYPFLTASPSASENLGLYQEVAAGLITKKMYRDAEKALLEAFRISPQDPRNFALAGLLDLRMEKPAEAKVKFHQALGLNGSLPEAWYGLTVLYTQEKLKDEALSAARKMLESEPADEVYQEAAAEAFFASGQWQAAREIYERLLEKRGGKSFQLMTRLVDLTMMTGSDEDKLAALRKMAVIYPRTPVLQLELAKRLEAMNRLPEALESFETAAELLPEDPGSYLNLARLYDKLGMPDLMMRSVKKAVKKNPALAQHPEIRKILARA